MPGMDGVKLIRTLVAENINIEKASQDSGCFNNGFWIP